MQLLASLIARLNLLKNVSVFIHLLNRGTGWDKQIKHYCTLLI